MFDGTFRKPVDRAVKPIGALLRKTRLTPDHLTIVGLLVGIAAAVAIGFGRLWVGLALVILAALPDLLDGALAKASGTSSQRGAFFDSTVDRVTDSLLLGGIGWHFALTEDPRLVLLPFAVASISSVISYQRAKAESLGIDAKGGLMERAERIIAILVGLAFKHSTSSLLISRAGPLRTSSGITPSALQFFSPRFHGTTLIQSRTFTSHLSSTGILRALLANLNPSWPMIMNSPLTTLIPKNTP